MSRPLDPARVDPERLATALEVIARQDGLTQQDIAESVGVSQQSVSDWLNQRKVPSRMNLVRLLEVFPIRWKDIVEPRPTSSSDVVHIPHDGLAAAGAGANGDAEVTRYEPYPARLIHQMLGTLAVDRLRSFTVLGDSMVPEIVPNATAIYAVCDTVSVDGLYVLNMDGAVVVKRVQRLPGGMLVLMSANPAYRDIELAPLLEADTSNTFRDCTTGQASIIDVIGKVVLIPTPV